MAASPEKLLLAAPRGYCAGVDRAVQTVEHALELYGAPVYVRKEIVHNKHVVEQLRERGAIFVEELDDSIPEGAITVFSAHGVSPAVHADAERRELQTIDATCPLVTKVHREALKFAGRGLHDRPDRPRRPRGGRGHDGRGARARSCSSRPRPTSTRSRSPIPTSSPTSRRRRCRSTRRARSSTACASASRTSPGPRTDDICYATTNRQAAVKQMAPHCDLVLVIGSRNSSNSNRLVEVAREHGADSHLIDNEEQVREEWLEGTRVVGITSGASAPEELVQRLVAFFRDRGTDARRGVRGRPGGRALHAPQDDPPGPGRPVGVSLSDHARANREAWGVQAKDYEARRTAPLGRRRGHLGHVGRSRRRACARCPRSTAAT